MRALPVRLALEPERAFRRKASSALLQPEAVTLPAQMAERRGNYRTAQTCVHQLALEPWPETSRARVLLEETLRHPACASATTLRRR